MSMNIARNPCRLQSRSSTMIALPRIIASPLTRKDTPMTPTPAEKNVLTVLESCFKIVPGMEAELAELQGRFWPVATSQPGFVSVQVGTIVNESKNQMDAW